TAAEYFDSFPDMGRKNAEVQLQEAIDRLWDRSIILKDDEKREEELRRKEQEDTERSRAERRAEQLRKNDNAVMDSGVLSAV
ncbi:hypothetical protein ACSLNA_25980, partial [Escherichia coli]